MIGGDESLPQIHFINLGNSKDHVIKAIERLSIRRMVIFTSPQLKADAQAFCKLLSDKGVEVLEVFEVDPFQSDSLEIMIRSLLEAHDKYSQNERIEIVSGLTGGTNIMAIAMGVVSMIKGLRCHYVISPPDDRVLEIDLFERLKLAQSRSEIEKMLKGGRG